MILKSIKNNKSGNTLIIVLSVMTVFLSITFAISKMFLNNLKNNRNSNNRYITKYASESGIERGFYLSNKLALDFQNVISGYGGPYTLENGAQYRLESDGSAAFYLRLLRVGETHAINISKPSDIERVKSIKVDWLDLDPLEIVEISLSLYINGNHNRDIFKTQYFASNTPIIINLSFPGNPHNSSYKLNFKAVNKDLHNMNLSFHTQNWAGGTPTVLDSTQGIQSTGTYLDNKQTRQTDIDLLNYFK